MLCTAYERAGPAAAATAQNARKSAIRRQMMKIQESAEHYLETLLILKERNGLVRSIDLANELGYSRPSVSVAVKQFRENGYVTVDEAGYIELTGTGREIAEKMYERHKTLSSLLERMGVSPATAVRDACRIEHVISDESFDKIKEFMKGK